MNIKRMVAQLAEHDLLRRHRGAADRRVWHLELTGDGEAALREVRRAAVRMRRSMAARLDPGQLRAATEAMDALVDWAGGGSAQSGG